MEKDEPSEETLWYLKLWDFVLENWQTILTDLTTQSIWLLLTLLGLFVLWLFRRYFTRPAEEEQKIENTSKDRVLEEFVFTTLNRSVRLSFGSAYESSVGKKREESSRITLDQIWTPLRVSDSTARAAKTGSHENMVEGDQGMPLDPFLYDSEEDLIILGEPGSGKSTSLAASAYHYARSWRVCGDRIPIWVNLAFVREVDGADNIELLLSGVPEISQVAKRLGGDVSRILRECIRESILSGDAVFLLDGLDEVKIFRLAAIKNAISSIKRRYKSAKLIVTCRSFDYRQTEPNRKIPFEHELELLPYDFEQQKSYVEKWYGAAVALGTFDAGQANSLCEALIIELKATEISEIAASPLLLALLTMVHSEEAKLPDSRAVLCDKAVNYMLADAAKWRVREAGQETVASPPVISLAIEVAYCIHKSEENVAGPSNLGLSSNDISKLAVQICQQMSNAEPTRKVPSPSDLVSRLLNSHGLLVETAEDTFRFSHRSFQEYLVGQYFSAGANDAEALKNAESLHWREPFRLMASLAGHEGSNLFYVISFISRLLRTCRDSEFYFVKTQLGSEMLAEIGKRRLALHKYERVFDESANDNVTESGLWALSTEIMFEQVEDRKLSLAERERVGVILGLIGDPRFYQPDGANLFANLVEIAGGARRVGTDKLDAAELKKTGGFLGGVREIDIAGFKISKYPITNYDYWIFMESGGYYNSEFWEGRLSKGWLLSEDSVVSELKDHWLDTMHMHHAKEIRDGEISLKDTENEALHRIQSRDRPYYWNDRRFNAPNQPVVGLNYWEAKAYCKWLSIQAVNNGWIKKNEIVCLPSEFEWECASRPIDDDRTYPWGNTWDDEKAHVRTNLLNLRQPSPVGIYLESWLAGPMDMAGNVWEWTDSLFMDYDTIYDGERYNVDSLEQRVVRGSSWYNNPIVAACCARAVDRSYNLFYDVGFRVIVKQKET